MKTKTTSRVDTYQMITDRIIEALENGVIPWKKTWKGNGMAQNYVSKHTYRGINAILTNLSPYDVPYFVTLKQANELGGKIKKGAKSLPIAYWKVIYVDAEGNRVREDQIEGHTDLEKRFFIRYYRVFNISDVEGVAFKLPEPLHNHNPIAECEKLVAEMPDAPTIQHGGSHAAYTPSTDTISIPHINQFDTPEAYYATLYHELIHSTGHQSRLNREEVMGTVKFGSLTYSEEELTAEIGATFLCNLTGIETVKTFENAAAYINSWLEKLQNDKKYIFKAASQAKNAMEYVLGY